MACVGYAQTAPESSVSDSQPATAIPTPSGDNVVIYRAHAEPLIWSPTVKIDGVKVIAIPNGAYTSTKVKPGRHNISLTWPFLAKQRSAAMEIDVQEGRTHFVEVTGTFRYDGGGGGIMYFRVGSGIAEATPEHAQSLIASCCKFKAPK